MNRIFVLQPYAGHKPANFYYAVITPEPIDHVKVQAAWSYAVRYTAKGLDLPDHEAAITLLKERHPSWTIIQTMVQTIAIDLASVEKDVPE
jgi:hypothetical protein